MEPIMARVDDGELYIEIVRQDIHAASQVNRE
jgi:hypothetical protein